MTISIFEAYEIDRASQIFKLVSLTAKKVQSLLLFGISAYGKSQVMNPESFFGELKRRNVIRMAGLYLVGAWLVVQVAGTVLPMFGAPEWLPRTIVVLLAIGFVPAVIFSWVFELTPEGLKREQEVAPEQSITPQTGRRMDRMIIVVLVLALGYFAFDKFVLTPRRVAALVSSPVPNESRSVIDAKSIAVLPFENLSRDPDNAYFAEGIQEEILTRLAGIADLKVISRSSTQRYQSKPSNLAEIAKQLGVAHVLEGSVQKSGDSVRVNVQLIKAADDSHIWADTFDRKLTDIFSVESEIAKGIADQLRAKLSPQEKARVEERPTGNTEAYVFGLRATQILQNPDSVLDDYKAAEQLYMHAIYLDPNFALAHARLASTRAAIFHYYEPTESWRTKARTEAEAALNLQPNLPEAHFALGQSIYWMDQDYDRALEQLDIASRLSPGNVDTRRLIAAIKRRQGKWEESLKAYEKLATIHANLGWLYVFMGRKDDAIREGRRAVELKPESKDAAEQD
ncbi:MAG TPA: hypothetical protein VFU09_02730 [Candidatus Udaeobacter sp.]|nr:hypothetical protein [Candidatus Udaeobacter sp.]